MTLKEFMDMDYGGITDWEVSLYNGKSDFIKYKDLEVYDPDMQNREVVGYGIRLGVGVSAGFHYQAVTCTVAVK